MPPIYIDCAVSGGGIFCECPVILVFGKVGIQRPPGYQSLDPYKHKPVQIPGTGIVWRWTMHTGQGRSQPLKKGVECMTT